MNETKNGTYCLPERLKVLRENRPLQKVADSLGISRASLGYYENGERKPDAEILFKIAEYYNVSCDYLLGRTEVKTTDSNIQMIHKTTGLNERAIETLTHYHHNATRFPESEFDTGPMYSKLLVETLNNLLFPCNDLLDFIMLYIYSNFENYYDDNNFDEEDEYRHVSELGFFDKKLGINFYEDYSFLSDVFLTKIQKELIKMRETYNNRPMERITPKAHREEKSDVPFE